jgi:hypothetical protein
VTGCYVDTPKADGIHFGQGSTFCKAIGNTVRNAADDSIATTSNETGFSFPRSRSIVIANNVVDGSIAGAGVNIYSSDDVIVSGNILRNIGYSGISVSFFEDAICNNVTIVGNMVDGCGQAEVQPNHYWFNSPLPDPPVTAPSFQSGIFAEGNGISIKNNTVTNAVSLPNGNPRTGTYLNGGSLISVTGNTFTVINGVGIDTGGASIAELTISGNTLDQVLDIGIWAHAPVTISQSITNNTGGFGAVGASPDLVVLQNAGATRTVITGNSSSGGRGISTDGTSTNFLASGNFS